MSVIDGIKSRQAEETRRVITVEKWNNAVLYCKTVTARDLDNVSRKHPNFLQSPTSSSMIDLIIAKVENEDGTKVFTLENKATLMREPVSVIAEVFASVFDYVNEEEQEKN